MVRWKWWQATIWWQAAMCGEWGISKIYYVNEVIDDVINDGIHDPIINDVINDVIKPGREFVRNDLTKFQWILNDLTKFPSSCVLIKTPPPGRDIYCIALPALIPERWRIIALMIDDGIDTRFTSSRAFGLAYSTVFLAKSASASMGRYKALGHRGTIKLLLLLILLYTITI